MTEPTVTLAALPVSILYVNVAKIGVTMVLVLLWALVAQWVDRDTDVVKTRREHWNMIVLSGALVGFIVLFVPPWYGSMFIVGIAFWLLVAGSPIGAYVLHRNSRVLPANRVLTPTHFKRLIGGGGGAKKSVDKGQRIQLMDHDGEIVTLPEDLEEAQDFYAVQDFLFDALWRRADVVDLATGKDRYRLVYRIDGVATENEDGLPAENGERIIRYLKTLAGLNSEEIRRPQSGKIKAALLGQEGAIGQTVVQTSGSTAGEHLKLSIADKPNLLRIHELGFAPPRFEKLKQILGKPHGLLLFSAPGGHGVTTTQYAVVRGHDAYINNIHSLERKLLTEIDNITQTLYDPHSSEVSYGRSLQSVVRREPDIVMVGECDDAETAMIAVQAASQNRKIYMGSKGRDCLDTLSKFLSLVNDSKLAAKAFLGVINQRLVRVLCTECREAFRPDPGMLKKLNLPADKIERFYRPPSEQAVDKKGRPIICTNCQGTGYRGRTGIFEVLVFDDVIAELIAQGEPMSKVKSQARKNKMFYLQEEGILKVIDGTTSMNEILRCLQEGSPKKKKDQVTR